MSAMNYRATFLLVAALAAVPSLAHAQDDYWRLGDSIRELSDRERKDLKELPSELADLPNDVMKMFLKAEGKHLESVTEDQIDGFVNEAKMRFKAHGARHLMANLKETFKALKITSKRVLAIVYKEEMRRLDSIPDRIFTSLVSEAFDRVIAERLRRLSTIKLNVLEANSSLNGPKRSYGWSSGSRGNLGRDSRIVKDLVLLAKEDKFVETLFKKEIKGEFGTLNLKAGHVEGLTKVKAGKLSFTDDFGRVHEGLGARFTVKTKFTVASVDAKSKRFELLKNQPVNVSAMLLAKVIDIASEAELDSTNIISTDGLIMHNEVRAGATVKASVRMPIDVDLKLFKIRVIPYAEAHAGVGAEAHFNLELEWSGRLAIDMGAAYSLGAGGGAGMRLEIMAGPLMEKIIGRIRRALVAVFRPIYDSLRGVREFGTAFESGKSTMSMDDLNKLIADQPRPKFKKILDIANRYAPVLYQEIARAPHDYIRKIDFDNDFNGRNNWNNSAKGDQKAYMYYDLKETKTHYFITYSWFYARRESGAISFLRFTTQHENDMSGVIVVVRKNAKPLHEVEMVMSANGNKLHTYSPNKKDRWKTKGGSTLGFSGTLKFVDEVDHPFFDSQRVHPQIFAKEHSHDVSVYNGRDDRDAFNRKPGVAYYPTGTAEKPESVSDKMVGYQLLPLTDLFKKLNNRDLFAKGTIKVGPAKIVMPKAFAGDEGANDSALPPWSWSHEENEARRGPRNHGTKRVVVVERGAMFADPAGTLSRFYKIPGSFSHTYLRNNMLKGGRSPSVSSDGALGGLRGSRRPSLTKLASGNFT
ncbi:MAG: hypothetical protein P1V97_28250 [Planctomycetota bacterium]|nr:hypothetical protein [Planctomycetota bacterium]